MTKAVVTGLLTAGIIAAVWIVGRPLRNRPRPPTALSQARYRRLAPVVVGLLVVLGALLVVSLVVAALS